MLNSAERLAHLEGRIMEHSQMFVRIEDRLTGLDTRVDRLEGQIHGLRRDLATQFRWTMGMLLTGFITIFTAVIAQ